MSEMKFVAIADLQIAERQRKEITPAELLELKRSIVAKGLFHAPLISFDAENTPWLVAGERRLRAMRELHEEGILFTYNTHPVPANHIPY